MGGGPPLHYYWWTTKAFFPWHLPMALDVNQALGSERRQLDATKWKKMVELHQLCTRDTMGFAIDKTRKKEVAL